MSEPDLDRCECFATRHPDVRCDLPPVVVAVGLKAHEGGVHHTMTLCDQHYDDHSFLLAVQGWRYITVEDWRNGTR